MKYVIACVNALWLICHPVIAVICFVGAFTTAFGIAEYLSCIIAGGLAVICFVTDILWYPMCRKKK